MNHEYEDELKLLEIENIIWVIFLLLAGINLVSNYYAEKYIYTNDYKYKKIFRTLNIVILVIALIIYFYYEFSSFKNVEAGERETLNYLILIASTLVLIAGLIYLYVEIHKSINPEISIL